MKNQITAIVVVYQKKLNAVPSLVILEEALNQGILSELIIYDNSYDEQKSHMISPLIHYVHNRQNVGLAMAYNYALARANQKDANLLLLLDQDTEVPMSYLSSLTQVDVTYHLAACLPLIYSGGNQISPVYVDNYIGKESKNVPVGLTTTPLMAINSGAAISVSALKEIGGFNEEFPLDYLDHWLFWRLSQLNKEFLVMDETLAHDLSVLDYSQVSTQRYESIIRSETLYFTKYNIDNLVPHRRHLKKRLAKQFLTVKNREIYKRTLVEIKRLKKGE
ncbi:glycosyltransferase [uncultured Vagococcus sp.]|uniref:glycosyltransferase n=1 Tax=uncultured Vagococcus sp. TaxID=189676 RepID=UPI0028D67117|nr:glycosyltransferase [uncultured Vagococcus sp.]